MVIDRLVNNNDSAILKCDLKRNEDIGLVFVYIILFAASAASLLFFTMVIVEAKRAKKRYRNAQADIKRLTAVCRYESVMSFDSHEHRYESGMSPVDEAELGKMWARKRSSLDNGRRETLKVSDNPRLPSIKERDDNKSLSDLYAVLPPTPMIEVEEAESLDTFHAGDSSDTMMRGRYTRGVGRDLSLASNSTTFIEQIVLPAAFQCVTTECQSRARTRSRTHVALANKITTGCG